MPVQYPFVQTPRAPQRSQPDYFFRNFWAVCTPARIQVKYCAFDAVTEMANGRPGSLLAYILLGRVAGFPEEDLQQAWATRDRDLMIKRALTPPKKR